MFSVTVFTADCFCECCQCIACDLVVHLKTHLILIFEVVQYLYTHWMFNTINLFNRDIALGGVVRRGRGVGGGAVAFLHPSLKKRCNQS